MILGLDTSTSRLSVALRSDGQTLAVRTLGSERRHNETLLPLLDQMLREQGRTPSALTGLAVGLGPGSFTGVRIGIATAQGLAQALGLPLAGISSFLILAAGSGHDEVLVVGDALQNMVYAAQYARLGPGWEAVRPERLLSLTALIDELPKTPLAVTGPAAAAFFPALSAARPELRLAAAERHLPDADVLIQLAEGAVPSTLAVHLPERGMDWEAIQPIYLRRTQAEEVRARREAAGETR